MESGQYLPASFIPDDLLTTQTFGRSIRYYPSVSSTNTLALQWAREGAPEGSVILADHQQAGRGRMGRSWIATPGENLIFSIILRPSLAPDRLGLVTVTSSLAVAEALDAFTSPALAVIKWPNDLLLGGRKCCGMLLESSLPGGAPSGPAPVVLGIGLNVNEGRFPTDLEETATSLRLATGRTHDRPRLLAHILNHLEREYALLIGGGSSTLRKRYEDRLAILNHTITLHYPHTDRVIQGRVLGIDPSGALRLQTAEGVQVCHAGEVTSHRRDAVR